MCFDNVLIMAVRGLGIDEWLVRLVRSVCGGGGGRGGGGRWVRWGVWCWGGCSSGLCSWPAALCHCVGGSVRGVSRGLSVGAAVCGRPGGRCWVRGGAAGGGGGLEGGGGEGGGCVWAWGGQGWWGLVLVWMCWGGLEGAPVVSVWQVLEGLVRSGVVAARAGCMGGAVALGGTCGVGVSSRVPGVLGLPGLLVEGGPWGVGVGGRGLEVVPGFCCLGGVLSAGGGCGRALRVCVGRVPAVASPSRRPPGAPSGRGLGVLVMCGGCGAACGGDLGRGGGCAGLSAAWWPCRGPLDMRCRGGGWGGLRLPSRGAWRPGLGSGAPRRWSGMVWTCGPRRGLGFGGARAGCGCAGGSGGPGGVVGWGGGG